MNPITKLTLKLLTAAAAVMLVLSSSYVYFNSRPQRTLLEETSQRSLELSTQRFQSRLGFASSDLKVISNFLTMKLFLDRGDAAGLQRQFVAFLDDKPFYKQLRYINEQGDEVIRADMREGKALLVTGKDLEQKGSRHFFQTAMGLPPGTVSVSRIDLKLSHGKLVEPRLPVLRFSTRVTDSAGRARGVVVLTYEANILLELAQPPVAAAEIYVTNDKGYFLKSVSDAEEFSFMFPDAPQSTFGRRFPAAWPAIALGVEGRIEQNDGLFYFSTLNSREEAGSELAFQKHKTVDAEKWKLIIRIPPSYFAAQREQALEWLLYFNLIGLLAITPLLYYYARLRVNQAEAQKQMERMKDEFVSVVSHELRTPLTSIRGALGLLNTEPVRSDPQKSRRMAELALSNTDRLVHLINNILDMEKIREGSLPLDIKECNSRQLLVQSSEMMRGMAEKHQVVLHVQGEGFTVPADAFRFGQVLNNLVGNAIKYSPESSVVEMWSEARNGEVVFGVRDKGRGIPPDKKEMIFGRFQQVDASDSRAMGGSGLGLAISRSIVLQHRGRIWVESEPEHGSTFYVALPRS